MLVKIQSRHLFLRDFDFGQIDFPSQCGFNRQSCFRAGRLNQMDHLIVTGQRLTRPVATDETEEAMISGIPF